MDKYEFNIKVDQMRKMAGRGDYATAMKIADTIDWRKVRNANLLSIVADIYEHTGEYAEAKDILLLAFERAPVGKRLLYKLSELSVKSGDTKEAEDFYREFCEMSPEDSRQYLLRYMILKEKGAPAEQLINSLEQYTSSELDEHWLYELARLYSEAGNEDECVKTCDKIMLLFGLGQYVDKAMELKLQYAPLTKQQMDLVENRDKYEEKLRAVEEEYNDNDSFMEDDSQIDWKKTAESIEKEEKAEPEEQTVVKEEKQPEPTVIGSIKREGEEFDDTIRRASDRVRERFSTAVMMDQAQRELAKTIGKEVEQYAAEEQDLSQDDTAKTRILSAEEIEKLRKAVVLEESEETISEPEQEEVAEEAKEPVKNPAEELVEEEPSETAEEEIKPANVTIEEETVEPEEEEEFEEPAAYHMIIEAETEEAALEIEIDELKYIHEEYGIDNKVAKTNAQKLNEKGVAVYAPKLAGKDLIVENAGSLSLEVIDDLAALMKKDQGNMTVVLIDKTDAFDEMAEARPEFLKLFDIISDSDQEEEDDLFDDFDIDADSEEEDDLFDDVYDNAEDAAEKVEQTTEQSEIEPEEEQDTEEEETTEEAEAESEEDFEDDYHDTMGIDDFADYAQKYAKSIDCVLPGKTVLALYERIEMMEEDGVALTKSAAEALIEEAADKAEKPSLSKRLKGMFHPKYDKNGMLILREENFIG